MRITFDDYKEAILERYEIAKNEDKSHYLLDPTPASLKKLAAVTAEHISFQDAAVFRAFFGFKQEEENKAKAILNFDTDKFRPLSKFLNGKSKLQDVAGANLLAVLLDLENRPFLKFKGIEIEAEREEIVLRKIKIKDRGQEFSEKNEREEKTGEAQLAHLESAAKQTFLSKPILILSAVLFIVLSAFSLHKTFEKKCMIWKIDHYEKIDCENNTQGFANYAVVLPIDLDLLENFKKVEISDTTMFFKNEKPTVWYLKQHNEYEFFNAPGFHPVNRKTLKEVTPHIIRANKLKEQGQNFK